MVSYFVNVCTEQYLQNHSINSNKIWRGCSWQGALLKLFKELVSIRTLNAMATQRKTFKHLQNHMAQSYDNWHAALSS